MEPEEAWDACIDFEEESDSDADSDQEVTNLEANLNFRFKPGVFACNLVWETDIPLHSRLRESVTGSSRGLHVTRMVLNAFAVTNRKNMFAYCDDRKNIFYFKLHEVIGKKSNDLMDDSFGISRSSSVSSYGRNETIGKT